MKWILSLSLFFILSIPAHKAAAQYDAVYGSYNDFYQDLANYGQWIEDPQYGYVWSPNVDGSFRPYYTNGYWVMTEYGNTWVSEYAWGWACFHYGRWTYDSYYGWLWIPGSDWGPAWVSWRYGDGFYGWSPLGPNYAYGSDYYCPDNWWVFIQPQYLYTGSYYHYWNGPRDNGTILPNTSYVNNTFVNNNVTYVTGPRPKEVEGHTHQPVQVYHLANSKNLNTHVHNNVVKMYHPVQIKPTAPTDGQRVTPPNVFSAPQPIKTPQSVKPVETPSPAFRNNIPKTHEDQPGANINVVAKPEQPQPRYETNPYEYDVNRPVPQPTQEPAPRQAPAQPTRQQPAPQQQPQPQQNTRPQPAPQQQPAPPRSAPAPAPAPPPQRATPAPAPKQNTGGRR